MLPYVENVHPSWLHTRVEWRNYCTRGGEKGKAALFGCKPARLPWAPDTKSLLVTISEGHEITIYKSRFLPDRRLPELDRLVKMTTFQIDKIQEFFGWPAAEAIYFGYFDAVPSELLPNAELTTALLDWWHAFPDKRSWWPTNRGSLGLSFLRNTDDGKRCIEIQTQRILLYRGPIAENEALYDHKVTDLYGLDELPSAHRKLSDHDYILTRLQCRYLQENIWELAAGQIAW